MRTILTSLSVVFTLLPVPCSSRLLQEQDFYPLPADQILVTDELQDGCSLECLHGSICAVGNQTLLGHVNNPLTGGPLSFHEELNRDGWFCSCPVGWTGLQCDRQFESCNDGQHVCYNGGNCIPGLEDDYGNEQLFCDCDDAIDPEKPTTRFVGKYCEEEVEISLTGCIAVEICQNGGACKPDFDMLNPCDCPEGFYGKYCEYVEDSVPMCTKECINGGSCRLGINSDLTSGIGSAYCECPPAFFGDQCEFNAERCGEEYCYHGSKCFEILLADGSTEHLCDCAKAYTEERHFAGEFCQYPSTQFCTGSDDPNGKQFCTNGGLCPQESHKPCDCPPGFLGPRCAYQIGKDGGDYAQCKLECKNGGTCQKGVKDLQAAYGNLASDVAHLLNETHQNYEHCTCPDGFFGIRCEYEVEQCDDHKCYHGSTCVDSDSEKGCDCSSSDARTAGLFCEFFATEDCSEYPSDFSDEHRGFCTNGGACLIDDAGSLRCRCPVGFEGPHCEFRASNQPNVSSPSSNNTSRISTGAKFVCAVGVCAIIVLTSLLLYRDQKYGIEGSPEMPAQGAKQTRERDEAMDGKYPKPTKAVGIFSAVEIL